MSVDIGAAGLLRAVGLLADGPVVWGRPVPARGSGVFVVELPTPRVHAPVELTRVGKWLERVPGLLLDGQHPSSRALAARLEAFWIPSSRVLFIGSTDTSIGGRIEAIRRTVLGERRPHPGGHWLHALTGLETARVWWAATAAIEEYEDALLTSFAEMVPASERAALHDAAVVLPFANLRTATGERKSTGLANSLQAADPVRKVPPTRVVEVAPGAAEGASGLPPTRAAGGTVRRAPRAAHVEPAPGAPAGGAPAAATAGSSSRAARPAGTRPSSPAQPAARRMSAARAAEAGRAARAAAAEPQWISSEGLARLRAEHEELTTQHRPAVIGRIKAAKELGDLKENADYTSAREEQSFLEGRIATIEATLRGATVIEAADTSVEGLVSLGATVTIEDETGGHSTFRIVGSAEADPAAGRISNVSPVGRALLGHTAGETVEIAAPRGSVHYRIVDVTS